MAATGNEKTGAQVIEELRGQISIYSDRVQKSHAELCFVRDQLAMLKKEPKELSMRLALEVLETRANAGVMLLGPIYSGAR